MPVLYTEHFIQFLDDNGDPLSNGKLYAYSAGTTTPKATYTTEEGDVEHAHPIVLDAAGRATVFIEGSYRFDLFDQNDVLVKSTDDVTSFTTLNESGDPFFQSFSGTGAQTVFTLSESLGDDSKDIMVFVNDESGDVGYDIQNPSAYTLSGTALTFTSAPPTGTDNVYVFAPTKLLGAASASAAAAAASEAAAAQSANEAAASAGTLVVTSTSSVEIGTGTKTFTVAVNLGLSAGQWVVITSDADPTVNYMTGQITSYSSTTLEVDVSQAFGSGTLADWTIKLSGVEGTQGATGGITGGTLTGNISGDSTYKLTGMIDPTSAQDYATKNYVDSNTPAAGLNFLGSYTASNVTSVDIGDGLDLDAAIDGTYDVYILEMVNVTPSTDGVGVYLRTSTDGGTSFDGGASDYDYAYNRIRPTGAGSADSSAIGDDADSEIVISASMGNATNEYLQGQVKIYSPSNATDYKGFIYDLQSVTSATAGERISGQGRRLSAADVDAIRVLMSSGNIASGTFYLYGLKKS